MRDDDVWFWVQVVALGLAVAFSMVRTAVSIAELFDDDRPAAAAPATARPLPAVGGVGDAQGRRGSSAGGVR